MSGRVDTVAQTVTEATEGFPMTNDAEPIECLNRGDESPCEGEVELRFPLSSTGRSFPRCTKHWSEALDRAEDIRKRYPEQAPSDFDPSYAGERWDDDY